MSEEAAVHLIENAVTALRRLVSRVSTTDLGGRCLIDNLDAANGRPPRYKLSSPAKQQSFLLSLGLGTPAPTLDETLSEEEWAQVYEHLESAFAAYLELFWPDDTQLTDLPSEWHSVRGVAMPAFLDYFNTGLLATVEQVRDRIERYIAPFDDVLVELIGISGSSALRISERIQEDFAKTMQQMGELSEELDDIREKAESLARARQLPASAAVEIAVEELGMEPVAVALHEVTSRVGLADPDALRAEFPDDAEAYLAAFTATRGSFPQINFPTEEHPWEKKALIRTEEDKLLIPFVNGLFNSILLASEGALTASASRDAYFLHRDRELESHVLQLFTRLFPQATFWAGLYETTDNQFEHDLIALIGDTVLIVEVKASPPIEPFRDPDRAFLRLRRAFHSDSGIQHAFEQGARLRRRLDQGEAVQLFDEDGDHAVVLDPTALKRRICICVTRDHFGPLATDLALLLEKDEDEPYPWATNVLDLESTVDAWEFLDWGPPEFFSFLQWRLLCHGKVFGADELEYVGYHIRHGSLKPAVVAPADLMLLNPSYSDFFDQLYNHRHFGMDPPGREVSTPVTMDLRESLRTGAPVFASAETSVGRNDECPCGSGKKYKRCCLRRN